MSPSPAPGDGTERRIEDVPAIEEGLFEEGLFELLPASGSRKRKGTTGTQSIISLGGKRQRKGTTGTQLSISWADPLERSTKMP